MGSTLKVDNIVGTSGTSAPITLSGDTATLGSGITFPSNHPQQTQIVSIAAKQSFTSSTLAAVTNFNKTVTVKVAGSKILVQLFLSACLVSNENSSNGWVINLTESTTSLNFVWDDQTGWTNGAANKTFPISLSYLHTHSQSVDATLTYTPKFANRHNGSSVNFNAHYSGTSGDNLRESYMILTEIPQ